MEKKTFDNGLEICKEISTEQQASIKITQNAKLEKTYEGKVYCDDPVEMSRLLDKFLEIAKSRI
jgi:tRNA U54 and U55 pseudouridine synthase Pus10